MRIPAAAALTCVAVLLAAIVSTGVRPAALHADGEIAVSIVDVDDAGFPTVQMVITADVDGRPLDALDAGQVRVVEGGAEAAVRSVTPAVDAGTPLALVVVVDTSGSMQGAPIEEARAAAASLIESLAPGDAAAVVAFADEVEVLQEMTADREALLAAVDRLTAEGNTALYDAVAESSALASGSGFARRAVVLLSDGQDFGGLSARTRDEALDAVTEGSSLFYVVGFGSEIDQPFLEEVAVRSGGRFFLAATLGDIATVYESLEQLLRSQLVVTFESAAPGEARERDVRVEVTAAEGTGFAERTYASVRPAPPPPTATQAPPAAAPVEPVEEGGSGPPVLPLSAAFAVLAGAAGAGAFVVRRRRRAAPPPPLTALDRRPLPVQEVERPVDAPGQLEVVSGPLAHTSIGLGDTPVTVGSAPACALRLAPAPGVATEHVRIWRRDGRPMLHHLARNFETRVNGAPVEWASIADGDEVEVGPYVIRYRSATQDEAQQAEAAGGTR